MTIAAPLFALDSANGSVAGLYDLAEVLRVELIYWWCAGYTEHADDYSDTILEPAAVAHPDGRSGEGRGGNTCAAFNIVPGPSTLLPTDDGTATWLRLFDFTGTGIFANAANGQFGPSPIVLAKGTADGNGVAPLIWVGTSYLGANLVNEAQQLNQQGTICVRRARRRQHRLDRLQRRDQRERVSLGRQSARQPAAAEPGTRV